MERPFLYVFTRRWPFWPQNQGLKGSGKLLEAPSLLKFFLASPCLSLASPKLFSGT